MALNPDEVKIVLAARQRRSQTEFLDDYSKRVQRAYERSKQDAERMEPTATRLQEVYNF